MVGLMLFAIGRSHVSDMVNLIFEPTVTLKSYHMVLFNSICRGASLKRVIEEVRQPGME